MALDQCVSSFQRCHESCWIKLPAAEKLPLHRVRLPYLQFSESRYVLLFEVSIGGTIRIVGHRSELSIEPIDLLIELVFLVFDANR